MIILTLKTKRGIEEEIYNNWKEYNEQTPFLAAKYGSYEILQEKEI